MDLGEAHEEVEITYTGEGVKMVLTLGTSLISFLRSIQS